MARLSASLVMILSLLSIALAQSQEWGQCGGMGWNGPTTCVAGITCQELNPFYSQIRFGVFNSCWGTATTTTPAPPTSTPSSSPTSTPSSTPTGSGLNVTAKANAGKLYFGSATDNSELSNIAYVAILKNNSQFGPANSMKWDSTEPSNGVFSFTNGDAIANFAKANSQLLGGVLTTHVTVTTVVSELAKSFHHDGTWRSFVFFNGLGTSYVSMDLTAARAADPAAKLCINDSNIETAGPKATAMLNLVKELQAANVPIDGIGMESHLIVGQVPASSSFISNWQQFTALGIEIAVTELDIRMTLPATAALLAQHQADYKTVVAACKAVAKCVDKYSWVPNTFSGQGEACPWDANLVEKPAYSGIVSGLTT
ncbi:endo-1,4-beta-xylanase C precursor [Mycena vulgaris]|nr:endo-1,4-beta-xylanase C precursor [Mycena vulgaris]